MQRQGLSAFRGQVHGHKTRALVAAAMSDTTSSVNNYECQKGVVRVPSLKKLQESRQLGT